MKNPALRKPPGYKDPTFPQPQNKQKLPPTSRRNPTVGSCCCLIILLPILLAALPAFIFLRFHPRLPSFRLQNLDLQNFNVSSRFDGTYLDATLTAKILAENRNSRLGLSCAGGGEGNVSVADESGDVGLGEGRVARFVLAIIAFDIRSSWKNETELLTHCSPVSLQESRFSLLFSR